MKKLIEIYPREDIEIEKYYVLRKGSLYIGEYNEIKDSESYCFITKTSTDIVLKLYERNIKDNNDFEDIFLKESPDWGHYITTYYSLNLIKLLLR